MTIFVDTSAVYALLDEDDKAYQSAVRTWTRLIESREPLITTNYVVVELIALVSRRLGIDAARKANREFLPLFDVHWIDAGFHQRAMTEYLMARRRAPSLVDFVSFEVMRERGITTAFAFDDDFRHQGFELSP